MSKMPTFDTPDQYRAWRDHKNELERAARGRARRHDPWSKTAAPGRGNTPLAVTIEEWQWLQAQGVTNHQRCAAQLHMTTEALAKALYRAGYHRPNGKWVKRGG